MTVAEHWPGALVVAMFGVQVIDGGSVSVTVTEKEQVALLPVGSVAVQVTVLVPVGKLEPLGGMQTTVTLVLQLSLTVGEA